ncbi:MAG: PSD1 and planctomycete cytochrome C domain-containing protein, partial [Limisphaerales bacterium]
LRAGSLSSVFSTAKSPRSFLASSLFTATVLAATSLAAAPKPATPGPLTFEKDIRPILKANCFHCHGEDGKTKGGLDARLRHLLAKGGEHGAAIVPGKPEKSLLFTMVRDGEMPKGEGKKLPPEKVELLRQWIAGGAKVARTEPAKPGAADEFTPEERGHWAFQPVRRSAIPSVQYSVFNVQSGNGRTGFPLNTEHWKLNTSSAPHAVDAFIGQKLAAAKLTFSPPADRATLIRRASLDLLGLPPSPAEVETFEKDTSPDAYEKLLDRLLASPHYGERWGRHWLDIAGYADSDGYTDTDSVRLWAWQYRDYVIRSLNADKPFNQFIVEQLAGDELVKPPHKNLAPADVDKLTATGFLRMAPDGTANAGVEAKVARNAVVADTIKVVSSSLLGVTVGCAQCHNHKHDPIPQADYYRMRAVFEPGFDLRTWRTPNARLVSLMSDTDRTKAAEVEKEAKVIEDARLKQQEAFINEVLEKELLKRPEELRAPLREAYKTVVAKRTPAQVKLLKEHPTVMQLSPGSLYLYEQKKADELQKLTAEAGKIREKKPAEQFIPVFTEMLAKDGPAPTFLFHRGDPDQPKQQLKPGDLTILASLRPADLPEKDAALPTSGRRLAYARSLTDGTHPLTARVLVNRVWLHHFGRGIVASPSDFGTLGERPTHPELLDWLASEFVAQGWSLKKLHRLVMTSAAYRQASGTSVQYSVSSVQSGKVGSSVSGKKLNTDSLNTEYSRAAALDPDVKLLWRYPIRRLDAEQLRDAQLFVSGKLNPKAGGAPVPIMTDETGQVVVGVNTDDTAGRPSGKFVSLGGEEFRRSLYVQMRRSKPLGLMETFDAPRMEPNCELRNASTVAPQSLALMNGEFALAQAKFFSERVAKEAGDSTDESKVSRAWQVAFSRRPNSTEMTDALDFLAKQRAHFTANAPKSPPTAKGKEPLPANAEEHALTSLCQALLTANRFLYVE